MSFKQPSFPLDQVFCCPLIRPPSGIAEGEDDGVQEISVFLRRISKGAMLGSSVKNVRKS